MSRTKSALWDSLLAAEVDSYSGEIDYSRLQFNNQHITSEQAKGKTNEHRGNDPRRVGHGQDFEPAQP